MTPTTNLRIITIVVTAIAIDALLGLATLSYCMIVSLKPDPTLITAYVGLTSGLSGALTGLLVNTRTQERQELPVKTTIENLPNDPVPVAPQEPTKDK
jgi:hypothetical protein